MGIFSMFNRKPAAPVASNKRSYHHGAQNSRGLGNWFGSQVSADKEIRADMLVLRGRARDLAKNNAYMRNYLALGVSNVLGPKGITFQANAKLTAPFDGPDKVLNSALEAAFAEWCEAASACGRMTFTQFGHLAFKTLATDGEAFIQLVRDDLNPHWFAVRLIDSSQVDHEYNDMASATKNEVRLGVEIDAWGRPVAYHLWDRHQSDENLNARKRERVLATDIVHIYDHEQANQTRGTTWFNPVMVPLQMLDGYAEAELMAAKVNSSKMGFLKYTDAASLALEDEIPTGPVHFDASPGSIEMLPPGVEFEAWNPSHPTTAYEAYHTNVLRKVASGLRVSYNALANDLSDVNYSSMRSGLLIEREVWRTLQQLMIARFYKPIFAAWYAQVQKVAAAGLLDTLPMTLPAKLPCRWVPRGWQWVDPMKDGQASVLAIDNGLTSRTAVLAETGTDFEEILEDLAREEQLAKDYGLTLGATANMKVVAALQDNNPNAIAPDAPPLND